MTERRPERPDDVAPVAAVIGAGYVGLTTAVCLAHLGCQVTCGEIDPAKVERLARGEPTIVEDGLAETMSEGLESGRLRFVVGAPAAVVGAEFVFLCVPTPQGSDGGADLRALESVAVEIGPVLERGAVVVNKSTVPVGSTHLVEQLLERPDVSVVSNPEFLREGSAIHDALHPDRIVVGADDQAAAARVGALFASTQAPLIVTDAATAETIKYASNAFLATKLSFVNAVANLCEAVGADVRDVMLGMAYDHRIGFDYLRPGPGWGGSCLPKDTRALVKIGEMSGYEFSLLRGAIETNETQLASVVAKVARAVGGSLEGSTVAAWGLTFKAGTDDRRDSPAVEIVRRLVAAGASVQAFDPTVTGAVPELASGVDVRVDAYAACEGAACLVVLTEWDELRWLDFTKVRDLMGSPTVVDARNLLDPTALRRMGFSYVGIGRP
ncbi:MAG TPA: UDP-glucose/GDP-mannose dehydrogenase family protein [Acidimicrobiales bacterium]|nr:UDP-glucose/GDP-mannose dehydrogenase family protein [Acidimicrobiales bacterium]